MSREQADVLQRSAEELGRVDELFRMYRAPQLAATLQRQPELARLGGEEREVSVLFADLGGLATVVPLGTTQLKGKREPVPIYRLVSVAS